MKKTILFLIIFGAQLAISANLPENGDKALNSELKKYFSNAEYSLFPLTLPESESVNGVFYKVNSAAQAVKYAYIGRVIACRSSTCALPTKDAKEFADFLDYLVLYNSKFEVQKIKVFRLNSDHGAEVTSQGWLRQFIGFGPGKKLTVGKEVDAVSGATITVDNFTLDIHSTTNLLNEIAGLK